MQSKTGKIFSNEKLGVGLLLLVLAGFFVLLALSSAGVYGGADAYWHYLISHFAFKHSHLFLDHWGKPLFTALSSPFSQLGFFGVQAFNILLSLFSAYLAYRVCKLLKLKFSWLSILLLMFAPVYFILVFTTLTETLFGFVLILGVYLFFKEKYLLAAIVISFLPFARTEGFVIIPLFAIALAYRKKWVSILFLATGFVFYSIVGYFYYKDLLWFFTQNPYTGAQDIYGKGGLWHFVLAYREIFGIGFTVLILLGIVACFLPFFRKSGRSALPFAEIFLLLMPIIAYFAAHSFLWWKGMNGSLGLLRVMAGVLPLSAVLGIKGLNLFAPLINTHKKIFLPLLALLFGYIIYEPFALYQLPFPNGIEEKVLAETAAWIKKENLHQQKVYAGNAYFFFELGTDVFDKKKSATYFPPKEELTAYTRPGDLCVWDAHFGPNECGMQLESFMSNKYFMLKAIFLPDVSFVTLGGRPYEVYVFQRIIDTAHADNIRILENLKSNYYAKNQIYLNTFSNTNIFADNAKINSCFKITNDIEFSPTMDTLIGQYNFKDKRTFEISVDVFPIIQGNKASMDFVSSITHKATTYNYVRFPVTIDEMQPNVWNHMMFKFTIPEVTDNDAVFKVYLWNNNKVDAYIDNLEVSVIEKKRN